MKVLLSWLREFAPIDGDPDALAAQLSDLGLAVEEMRILGGGLDGIVVARVLGLRPHPQADKIQLVDVDPGDGGPLQICCGAFNMAVGDLVPLATLGTVMPDGMKIERRKLRGEWSNGMLCSGRELGLGDDRVRDLELGAMLHDIGKCKIPDAILNKPGKLTPEEWDVMRLHPEYGAEIVERLEFLRGATEVVRCHHERWDGAGYPGRLAGEAIPLAARIFMVVDAYDTITSKRPYKEPQPPEAAIDEIRRCAGTHFDPEVVAAFERVFPEFAQATRARHASAAVHAPVPVG